MFDFPWYVKPVLFVYLVIQMFKDAPILMTIFSIGLLSIVSGVSYLIYLLVTHLHISWS